MVTWRRNYQYFYNKTRERVGAEFSSMQYWETIEDFCLEYRCFYSQDGNHSTCNEEDFTVLMLKCPEAVEHVI